MDRASEVAAELKLAYAAEIEVIQNYLANAINLEGPRAEGIKELLDGGVQTALAHARRLAKRIKALDGRVPGSRELPRLQNDLQPPVDNNGVDSVLLDAIRSEDAVIARYERIIQLCDGHDFVSLDLVIELLVDERERRQRLLAFLPGAEVRPRQDG
jgi:ferritin-like protein